MANANTSIRRARRGTGSALALLAGLALANACTDVQRSLPRPEGAFGTLCTTDATCAAKACVPHLGGTVCSQSCDARHPCPTDWSCWTPLASDASGADAPRSYCVSSFWALCRPCDADVDCAAVGTGGVGSCVDYDHQGSFCGNACDASTDCPEGYRCDAVTTADGRAVKACVHASGFCPCTPYLATLGAPTRCHQANEHGVCAAERTCDSKSWSPCTAAEPAAEVPNLLDDDCDGITDEDACFCGDAYCDAGCGESLANCPCDCATSGDGLCSPCGENPSDNPEDCCRTAAGTTGCGDGVCLGFGCGENPSSCASDCGAGCGNQLCEPGENPSTCAADCAHQVCGNHVCEPSDGGPAACPGDCLPTCGDCVCDPLRDESVHNCPIDCGYCGDGVCSACALLGETRRTCARDCCVASAEICNSIDDDCNGTIDDEGAGLCVSFFADADGDGLGDPATGRCLCAPTDALTTRIAGDCDDQAAAVGRGPPESCNALDDDCDGGTDEDFGLGEPCAAPGGACWDGAIACDGPDRTTCADTTARAAGSLCRELACVDGLVRPTATCDDAGGCVILPWVACGGYACEASGRCRDTCATSAECRTGFACGIEHTCEQIAPDCTSDARCIDQDWRTLDLCIAVCAHPPRDAAVPGGDEDGDGIANTVDLCPETADPAQHDSDGDGVGDACDRCEGPGADETCNGLDDDCDGSTDEDFSVGLSCIDASDPCRIGKLRCNPDGKPGCSADRAAPVGFTCGAAGCEGSGLRLGGTCTIDGTCQTGAWVACNGYRCAESPDEPDNCMTSCVNDSHCTSDYTCVATPSGGRCAPKKSNGEACGKDAECWHGHCVDGVCCESACTETCFTCAGPDSAGRCVPAPAATDPGGDCGPCALCDALGSCAPAPAATDPKGACLAQGGCGTTGTCDGLGACALGAALTPCGQAECIDGRLTTAGTCDGEGGCLGVTTEPCKGNFACGPGALYCLGICASDRHCAAGYFCNAVQGTCLPLRGKGIGCTAANECESGQCVDGVCCATACTGNCLTCAKAGAAGTCLAAPADTDPNKDCGPCDVCNGEGGCRPVPAGKDPAGDCTEVPGGCSQTGACDGAGACALRAASFVCSQARCVGSAYVTAQSCDGDGACPTPTLTACNAYRCDDAGVACRTACSADSNCQSGYYCTSVQANGVAAATPGVCKAREALGAVCARNFACDSGSCADGRCCDTACGDLCESCALGGKLGTCSALDGVSDGACSGSFVCAGGRCAEVAGQGCEAPSECASDFCENGACCQTSCAGACRSCADGTCADVRAAQNLGRCDGASWCDAGGACVLIAGAACDPLLGCPDGWACIDGVCTTPRALGADCAADGDCASGACADSVCCDDACEGTCLACGPDGRCATAAIGSADPGCPPGAVCGQGGDCGTPSGAACPPSPGECASGQCVDGVCCASGCSGACTSCATGTCTAVANGQTDPGTCDAPAICLNGTCAMLSEPCESDGGCPSHQCFLISEGVGVCCDADCGGPCQTCVATMGTCTPVTSAENADRCEGTMWCDAGGSCVPKSGQACDASTPCAAGYYCGPQGTCAPMAAAGADCATSAGCASGFCVDGVCCESACEGACRYCANAGALGTCLIAPTGTDPGGDCGAGQTCSREAGGCRAANGQACGTNDAACASGACTDGVCCASACGGACETCAGEGTAGTCAVVRGRDDDQCQGPLTCAANGACLLAPGMPCGAGSECESGACTAGVCCPSGCAGACEACLPDGSCATVLLEENPERCEFADDLWCNVNGDCMPVRVSGSDCGVASDCTSGHCVDGVCCEDACDGTCEVCDVPGRRGSCERAMAGTDPHARCEVGQTCAASGACRWVDGTACDADAACASGACVDGVCCESACAGSCEACNVPGASGRCSPVTNQADPDTCATPWQCGVDGTCLLGLGQPCAGDAQCVSGECENAAGATGVDFRVCCQTDCDGACQNCVAGTGACQALTRVEDTGMCVDPAWCDGAGACSAKLAARCKEPDAPCPDGYYCDVSIIGPAGDSACLPAAPDGSTCNTNPQCESDNCRAGRCCDASCADPFTCDATGECGLPNGLPCASGGACVGGLCVDDVCCATPCEGTCMACDTPGALGMCAPVTGTDESCAGYCSGGTCAEGLECDGARPCPDGAVCHQGSCIAGQLPSGGQCVTDGQCTSGHCVDGVCCNTSCTATCYACNGADGGVPGMCSPISGQDMACHGGTNGTCQNGTCLGGPGAPCTSGDQCMGGVCSGNLCGGPGGQDATP